MVNYRLTMKFAFSTLKISKICKLNLSLSNELIYWTSDLEFQLTEKLQILVDSAQCTEFRVLIVQIKLAVWVIYLRMLSRNWNILKPYLALVSSAYFYWMSFCWRNNVHASFLFWLFSLVYTLKNQIRSVWPFYGYHLQLKLVSDNHSRKGELANLALKFVKIVSFNDTHHLLFYFTVNPLF